MPRLITPAPTSAATTAAMKGNVRTGTKLERRVRSALHRKGLRFRKDYRVDTGDLRVYVDIVFVSKRLAIFLDGCYWHACALHLRRPKSNDGYWTAKLNRNIIRDAAVRRALERDGWCVLRFWEHDEVDAIVDAIVDAVRRSARRRIVRSTHRQPPPS